MKSDMDKKKSIFINKFNWGLFFSININKGFFIKFVHQKESNFCDKWGLLSLSFSNVCFSGVEKTCEVTSCMLLLLSRSYAAFSIWWYLYHVKLYGPGTRLYKPGKSIENEKSEQKFTVVPVTARITPLPPLESKIGNRQEWECRIIARLTRTSGYDKN